MWLGSWVTVHKHRWRDTHTHTHTHTLNTHTHTHTHTTTTQDDGMVHNRIAEAVVTRVAKALDTQQQFRMVGQPRARPSTLPKP